MDSETKMLHLLRQWGYEAIQSPDWLAKRDGEWICWEVKHKELYTPGKEFPYYGIGLDKSQLYLRTRLLEDWGVRTVLVNFVPGTNIFYYAFLDELEKGEFYDTPKGIRIYPVDNFNAIQYAPNENIGA